MPCTSHSKLLRRCWHPPWSILIVIMIPCFRYKTSMGNQSLWRNPSKIYFSLILEWKPSSKSSFPFLKTQKWWKWVKSWNQDKIYLRAKFVHHDHDSGSMRFHWVTNTYTTMTTVHRTAKISWLANIAKAFLPMRLLRALPPTPTFFYAIVTLSNHIVIHTTGRRNKLLQISSK